MVLRPLIQAIPLNFENIKWAPHQMRYILGEKDYSLVDPDSKVFAVSRSIHYGLFLSFEGNF